MAHDHNGRVGPPRCEECNAPLNSDDPHAFDDRLLELNIEPSLCLDCHLERNPFPRIRKRKGRPSRGLRAGASEFLSVGNTVPNLQVEPLSEIVSWKC
jgi:hypothetical protein